jgi:hypothetical protein
MQRCGRFFFNSYLAGVVPAAALQCSNTDEFFQRKKKETLMNDG